MRVEEAGNFPDRPGKVGLGYIQQEAGLRILPYRERVSTGNVHCMTPLEVVVETAYRSRKNLVRLPRGVVTCLDSVAPSS